MSDYESNVYESYLVQVATEISSLRVVLEGIVLFLETRNFIGKFYDYF